MVLELAKKHHPYMVDLRRYLHMHPEVSMKEFETSKRIRKELDEIGLPYRVVNDTGIMAELKGAHPGKTLALRADMDALSVQELSNCPYKSQNEGVMHACGHDGHVASLLGAAKILTEMREQLHGTVRFFFESGEELGGTIDAMEQAGWLEGLDHCFGIHIWADIPVGQISMESGARMAGTDLFTLKITGRGAHASTPDQGIDAAVAAASIIMNLQTIVSRELSPQDIGVVTIGKLTAGQRFNSIADEAILEGNLRSFSPRVRAAYPDIINRIAENTARAFRAKSEMIYYLLGTPPMIITQEESDFMKSVATKLYGKECLSALPPIMAGEDFATFIEKVGGGFAFVGGGFRDRENAPHHNGNFDIDEDSLQIAASIHAQYALDYLSGK